MRNNKLDFNKLLKGEATVVLLPKFEMNLLNKREKINITNNNVDSFKFISYRYSNMTEDDKKTVTDYILEMMSYGYNISSVYKDSNITDLSMKSDLIVREWYYHGKYDKHGGAIGRKINYYLGTLEYATVLLDVIDAEKGSVTVIGEFSNKSVIKYTYENKLDWFLSFYRDKEWLNNKRTNYKYNIRFNIGELYENRSHENSQYISVLSDEETYKLMQLGINYYDTSTFKVMSEDFDYGIFGNTSCFMYENMEKPEKILKLKTDSIEDIIF